VDKAMITVVWDCKGMILVNKNAARRDNQLTPTPGCWQNSGSISKVWPHKNQTEILLQCDNAVLHVSVQTQEAITNFGWAVLPGPQSSNHRFPPI
jgi:hypothetical protein